MLSKNKKYISGCVKEIRDLERSVETVVLLEQRLMVIASYLNTISFDNLKPKHVKKMRDDFYYLPVNASKIKEFSGLNYKDICRINKERGSNAYPTISNETHRGYFSSLANIGSYLRSEGITDSNPLKDIKFKRATLVKANEKNRAFEINEWNEIFEYISNSYSQADGFKYWIVYLLRYTGARLKELLQLVGNDLVIVDCVKCIMIYPNQYKTKGSGRLIPLHPKLIELGFVNFAEKKDGKLFPESEQEGRPLSYKTSKWAKYWRTKLGLGKGKNLISFRHSFIDDLKKSGVELEKRAQLAGHCINTTADVYSKDYPMDVMFKVVSLII